MVHAKRYLYTIDILQRVVVKRPFEIEGTHLARAARRDRSTFTIVQLASLYSSLANGRFF